MGTRGIRGEHAHLEGPAEMASSQDLTSKD